MKALPNLFLLALAIPSITSPSECVGHVRNSGANAGFSCSSKRRILHQPLYPISWTPPPNSPEIYSPFFPQAPPPQPDSDQPNVPTISTDHSKPIQPPNHQVAQPIKKIAIGFSVSIATLSILAALAFCLHRYRMKYIAESIKLVRDNSQPIPTTTSSNVLYLGTLEPSNRISRDLISSPYHRLNAVRGEEEHRPSPELQRLPPLPRLLRHFLPSSASSDEETVFYSPRESVAGNSESSYSPVSQQSSQNLGTNATTIGVVGACKSTRRTNLSNFSVDTQLTARLPSPPPPPPPPLPRMRKSQLQSAQAKTLPPLEKKMKFQSPPSPLGKTPHSVFVKNSPLCEEKSINLPPLLPPPPPPPPPPPSVLGKISPLTKTSVSSIPVEQLPRSNCQIPTLTSTPDDKHSGSLLETLKRVQEDAEKPRLKPLHWDKVRASSDRATVWDQLKSGTFQLNEDIIESLFISNPAIQKKTTRRPVLPPFDKEKRVLDPKKSQNIAILLRALNVTREEVSEALLDGNPDGLGTELLETMVKMAPTKEEELKLKNYDGDIFKLGSAECFLKELLDIPFAFKRVDAMLYRVNFDTEVKYLQKSYETIEAACAELKNSRLFLKLLEAVLRTGNRMNVGTNRGEAKAFKLDTLLKLVDIKGVDGKTTLLHFVVQEIIRSEGLTSDAPNQSQPRENNNMEFKKQGLRVIAALGNELGSVRKAAGMDSDALSSYLSKLQMGLEKIKQTLHQHENNGGFFESMNLFVEKSEGELVRIKDEERVVMSHVKEVTEYFHGEMAKEEGHPLRIFVVVRDFLVVLDQVCKEVERMDDRRTVGSVRSFRISANASSSLPVFSRLNTRQEKSSSSSSDDDSSST